ncbi:MAG: metallophosphoesterase family protein [Fusobacteriaceae bacterium]
MKTTCKILAISDVPILTKYHPETIKPMFRDIDFIVSTGDLSNDYLDYIFTSLNKDLIFVNGNHIYNPNHNIEFCKNIDQKIINFKGLRIMGLDGSQIYSYGEHQYSEKQVFFMIIKNIFQLIWKKPDVIISHSPPKGIHDLPDHVHTGFKAYHLILKYFKPKTWIHGHIHLEHHHKTQESIVDGVKFINAYGYKIIELEVPNAK